MASFILLSLLVTSYQMLLASGEQSEPKAILLRLEDVGPGGEYSNIDQLGKLRAVLGYLQEHGVPYQIGVIPRWVNYSEQGLSYERSLDDQGDLYTDSLVRLLKQAADQGAVIGMHGYTHQVGQGKRADGHQETGIGNEFDVADLPETSSPSFAEERLAKGLKIFKAAGLPLGFWETPHYHGAAAQYPVFASHFGLLYENKHGQASQPDLQMSTESNLSQGAGSRGAAYVPTPYSYIPYNKDEQLILNQLGKTDRLPSFFYHAFLEFKHLLPVTDESGEQVYKDGLPEYRYPDKSKSNLQKLIVSIHERGYEFYSLYDYAPFTPWTQLSAGIWSQGAKLGDATGDGQLDTVVWQQGTGKVTVAPGQYRGDRDAAQPERETWATLPRQKGDLFSVKDGDGDGKADLWIVRASGQLELYLSDGHNFKSSGKWKLVSLPELSAIYMMKQADGHLVLAALTKDGTELIPYYDEAGVWKSGKSTTGRPAAYRSLQQVVNPETGADQLAYCRKGTGNCARLEVTAGSDQWTVDRQSIALPHYGDRLLLGDYNGDGREDVLVWEDNGRKATVYRQNEAGSYAKLSSMQPWGISGARPFTADFDGNGKLDLGLIEPDGTVDTGLSYQTAP